MNKEEKQKTDKKKIIQSRLKVKTIQVAIENSPLLLWYRGKKKRKKAP